MIASIACYVIIKSIMIVRLYHRMNETGFHEVTSMNKKDLRHMCRRELVEIVCEMSEQESKQKPGGM